MPGRPRRRKGDGGASYPPSATLLQRRALGERVHPAFAIFDCLERDGVTLLRRPLAERRRALETIVLPRRGAQMRARRLPPNGLTAYRIAQKRGWEGIMAKDDASAYEPGRRATMVFDTQMRVVDDYRGEFVRMIADALPTTPDPRKA